MTKDDILNDFESVASHVLDSHEDIDEKDDAVGHWFRRACLAAISQVQSTPQPIFHTSANLIIDAWGWIPPSVRNEMQEQSHPFWQAVNEIKA